MAGILGFSYADAGALVGGVVGGLTPIGFVGSAVVSGTLAGVGAFADGRDLNGVLTEMGVAAIGAAGGGWAVGEVARAGMKVVAPRLARAAAEGSGWNLQRIGLKTAETVLRTKTVPPPKVDYYTGLLPALAGGFAGFWATDQNKMLTVPTVDIGNGGCPVKMGNLQMPAELGGTVGDMYRKLPAYLCDVWNSFGTGKGLPTPTVKLPTRVTAEEAAGIPTYAAKVEQFNHMIQGFVDLDRQVLDLVASGVENLETITAKGQLAVSRLIDAVNKDAGTAPPSGKSLEAYALDRVNDAFADGREILSQAILSTGRWTGPLNQKTDQMEPPPESPAPESPAPESSAPEPEGPGGR